MTDSNKHAASIARFAPALVVGATLVAALSRKSQSPDVLGRYSLQFAAMLCFMVASEIACLLIAIDPRRWAAASAIARSFGLKRALKIAPPLLLVEIIAFFFGEKHAVVGTVGVLFGAIMFIALTPGIAERVIGKVAQLVDSALFTNIAALSVGLLLSALSVEASLRIAKPRIWLAGDYKPEALVDFTYHGPGANELGFRDVAREIAKPANTYRIASIGDSFAFGVVPAEANYNAAIERKLAICNGKKVEVLNFGTPGYGPDQYVKSYVQVASKYSPDAVVVGFFVGNDFFAEPPGARTTVINGRLKLIDGHDPRRFLPSRWFLAKYVSIISRTAEEERRLRAEKKSGAILSEQSLIDIETSTLKSICSIPPDRDFESHWEGVKALLSGLKKKCDADGRKLVVAIFPDQLQVDDVILGRLLEAGRLDRSAFDIDRPQRALLEFAKAEGIPAVDLLPGFRAANSKPLYTPNDTHWNEGGNELAGEIISSFLADGCR